MSYSGIEHKLRVFISSKCGGKYTIARKALKRLLECTGLVEVYAFETEPASSEDAQSAYLEYVDNSNLCIFLVDNKDGVPPAVLSEEKRAKDKQLRLLYVFCDEEEKEATPMQLEVKINLSQKYKVVHEFSDIVTTVYDSVMQDIIAVYKRKEGALTKIDSDSVDQVEDKSVGPADDSGLKSFSGVVVPLLKSDRLVSRSVCRVLAKDIFVEDPTRGKDEPTSLEKLLSEFLEIVLFQKEFDEAIIDGICAEVLNASTEQFHELLKVRFAAQKQYYKSDFEECIETLQKAIRIALDNPEIPTWIANDIAIDIRMVQGAIDELNSRFTINNIGQQYIDRSSEPVYYPYLDRQAENMQEEIAKRYYTQLNISPYSTNFGGLNHLFDYLSNVFSVAALHGSIVQTKITRDRLISIYSMLCTLYDDHDLVLEFVRLLVINRDKQKLDTLIRRYNQPINILNSVDIKSILDSIGNSTNYTHSMMSKYLLASRLGYYIDDESYQKLCDELVQFAMDWVKDEQRVFNIGAYIFDFFRENTHRANKSTTIEFICAVFGKGLARFYPNCFKIIRNIDFSEVDSERQQSIKDILKEIASGKIKCQTDQYYSSAVIRFCKTATLPFDDLESAISEHMPSFYEDTFTLEMSAQRGEDPSTYITVYIDEARARNTTQGKNGAYTGYGYESFDVIYNIIALNKLKQDTVALDDIVSAIIETLATESQTVKTKLSAVKLLQFLYTQNRDSEIWGDVILQLIQRQSVFSSGYEMGMFDKETNTILSFQYELFLCIIEPLKREIVLEELFSLTSDDTYTILYYLRVINNFLEVAKAVSMDNELLSALLFFSMQMSTNRERDIKYYASRCLIELTSYEPTRRLALMHLSRIMENGSTNEKIAIITRVSKIESEDNSYKTQILNKGKADNNYLVRYVAERESQA